MAGFLKGGWRGDMTKGEYSNKLEMLTVRWRRIQMRRLLRKMILQVERIVMMVKKKMLSDLKFKLFQKSRRR